MGLLVAYIMATLLALIWIAWDAETIYVLDVFGRNLHYVWSESGRRWRYLFTYGWRLGVACSLVLVNGVLSCQFYRDNPFQLGASMHFIALAVMLFGSFAAIPWIYIANGLRCQGRIRRTALQLSDFVERISADPGLAQTMERAEYATEPPWTAWHPTMEDWQSDEGRHLWSNVLPVVYVRTDSVRSALFPVDWEAFLAWNASADLGRINSVLPVHGPGDSSFSVRSVQQLRGCPNWSLVRVEMQSELDAAHDRGG